MRPLTDSEVSEWLRRARDDWATIRAIRVTQAPLYDVLCFHSQQSAEKLLKMTLIAFEKSPPRTHDLTALLRSIATHAPTFADVSAAARFLTPFATVARYPGFGGASEGVAARAEAYAAQIIAAVEELFGGTLGFPTG